MKKVFVVLGLTALLFGFNACNKHCVCTVSKDGQTIREYDYSDQELKRNECMSKGDEIMDNLISLPAEELIDLGVKCEHL